MASAFNYEKSPMTLSAFVARPPPIYPPWEQIYFEHPTPIATHDHSLDLPSSAYDSTAKECNLDARGLRVMTDHDANSRPLYFSNWAQEWAFVFTVMLASSSTTVIQGVILIMTETIGDGLHATSPQVTWIAAAVG